MAQDSRAAPISFVAPEMARDPVLVPGQASKQDLQDYAIPLYVRLQIPLRTGRDFSNASIPHWPTYAAEIRKLLAEMDRLHAEHRSSEIHRLRRLMNLVSHANKQLRLDEDSK